MLPSILSEQVLNSLKNFISTGFETQTHLFKGMFTHFSEEQNKFFKGAYLSIDLPFLKGKSDENYFSTLRTDFPPYFQQEQALFQDTFNKDTPQSPSALLSTTHSPTVLMKK